MCKSEFMNAKVERDLKKDGKVVNADELLRPKLKSHTLSAKRKQLCIIDFPTLYYYLQSS